MVALNATPPELHFPPIYEMIVIFSLINDSSDFSMGQINFHCFTLISVNKGHDSEIQGPPDFYLFLMSCSLVASLLHFLLLHSNVRSINSGIAHSAAVLIFLSMDNRSRKKKKRSFPRETGEQGKFSTSFLFVYYSVISFDMFCHVLSCAEY